MSQPGPSGEQLRLVDVEPHRCVALGCSQAATVTRDVRGWGGQPAPLCEAHAREHDVADWLPLEVDPKLQRIPF